VKLNKPRSLSKTVNYEGATSYKTDAKTELISRVLCSLVGEKKFYVSGEDSNKELISLLRDVANTDIEFCLKLAAYARNEFHLRSIPQLILIEMTNHPKIKGTGFITKYVPYIIKRADEITECMAYHLNNFGKPVPTRLKKAISKAFNSFSKYQLAKYNRDGQVKLRDAMFLSHPKPIDDIHTEIFKKLADKNLEPPDTWEVIISGKGSTKENWESVVELWLSGERFGNYFAGIRNLRNLLKVEINDELLDRLLEAIRDPENVKRSQLLPFRFLSAYKQIQQIASPRTNKVLRTISSAMNQSLINLPELPGYTCIAVDLSGSMDSLLSERGITTYADVACVLGAGLNKVSNGVVIGFGEKVGMATLDQEASVLSSAQTIRGMPVGHSTNAYLAPMLLADRKVKVDRLILLSDMQCWNSTWFSSRDFAPEFRKYKNQFSPDCYLYSVDLAGYGKGIQVPQGERNTVLLAGWSDRIFDFIANWEKERVSQVKMIKDYLS